MYHKVQKEEIRLSRLSRKNRRHTKEGKYAEEKRML
jgi:hypothetical protein